MIIKKRIIVTINTHTETHTHNYLLNIKIVPLGSVFSWPHSPQKEHDCLIKSCAQYASGVLAEDP